jgi:hypothetical protein
MLVGMHTYDYINDHRVKCAAWAYPAIRPEDYNEIRLWCRKTFGDAVPDAYSIDEWMASEYIWRDYVIWGEIEFKHEKHLNWFLLKWR